MKEAVVLVRFLRHDPVGQCFGVTFSVVAWLALAWTSLAFAVALPLVLTASEVVRRRRNQESVDADDLEDLY
jgi:hypothetical protein